VFPAVALRAQLGFDGTLREVLVELANDGGATIFVDNLDSFSTEERLTVVDVVGEASVVPGVAVVATARREFGIDEPSWLPSDALARLGQTDPITIGELSKLEIEQLKVTDPSLAPLLTDGHPARQVARNLFRLARLASQPASDPVPRTEVDMAEQWWTTADGARDAGWRDRTRLLQAQQRRPCPALTSSTLQAKLRRRSMRWCPAALCVIWALTGSRFVMTYCASGRLQAPCTPIPNSSTGCNSIGQQRRCLRVALSWQRAWQSSGRLMA
jgi:hypothetical protein